MKYLIALIITLSVYVSSGQVPVLNSYKVSSPEVPVPTIFLDFDGYFIDSSNIWFGYADWKEVKCADAGLTRRQITEVFNIVAEDYRPFHVNVTTDSIAYQMAPAGNKVRVVITTTNEWYPGYAGGVAFVGTFTSLDDNSPVWVWSNVLQMNTKYIGDACSHEAGHSLGLWHHSEYDRNTCEITNDYNWGQFSDAAETSWAPIMGASYNANLSTWYYGDPCKGTARDTDNDLHVLTSLIPYRADDHPRSAPETLVSKYDTAFYVESSGVIERQSDSDQYKFTIPGDMQVHFLLTPTLNENGTSNIDLRLSIRKDNGRLIRYTPHGNLSVFIDTFLTAGTYNIFVAGDGDALYTSYGSLGSYKLIGDNSQFRMSVNLGPDTLICNNNILILDAKNQEYQSAGLTYLWNTGETSRTIFAGTGTYWVTVRNPRNNTEATDTIRISDIRAVNLDFWFKEPQATCISSVVNFEDRTFFACGASRDNTVYTWDFGDNSTSSVRGNVQHKYQRPGTYRVLLSVTTEDGSEYYSMTREVFIPQAEKPTVNLGPDVEICRNQRVELIAKTDASTSQEYTWNTGDTTKTIRVANTGRYIVQMTTSDGCEARDTVRVVASRGIKPDFDLKPEGLNVIKFFDRSLTCSDGVSIDGWKWDFGDGTFSTEQHPQHSYREPGSYRASLTTRNAAGDFTVYKDFKINRLQSPSAFYHGARLRFGVNSTVALSEKAIVQVAGNYRSTEVAIFSTAKLSYQLITTAGQLLQKGILAEGMNKVDLSAAKPGIIILIISNASVKRAIRLVSYKE